MDNLLARFANAFPLWVFLCSALAVWHPPLFTWFSGPWITWGLGVIMLGMGITLTAEDFTRVLQFPSWVAAGVILQYTVMPLSGWAIANLLALPDAFAVGLILVACCPGGTASNVVSYLARANVALSVTLTTLSTILAVAMTPWLTAQLAGPRLLAAVVLLHASGFGFGYLLSKWWNSSETVARTVSIEVGMQNSGLGAHLARSHFPAGSGVDIPSAISALTHCMIGSLLAAIWRRIEPKD